MFGVTDYGDMNMWKFFVKYFTIGVDDDVPPPDDDTPPPDDDVPPPDDDTPPSDPEPAAPRISRAQQAIITQRERAQKAERDAEQLRRELAEARRQPAAPSQEDLLFQQEEATLKSLPPDSWERYAIESRREARQSKALSLSVMNQAKDLSDKSEFSELKTSKPALFEKYQSRVEERLAQIRASGGAVPPRKAIMAFLLGEDQLNGKVKTATPTKSPTQSRVSARSDVSPSSGGRSEEERALARLEGVRI